eukprot:91014-Prymnesium_polylepis.2
MLLAYGDLETYGKDKRTRVVHFWGKLVTEVKALEDDDDPFVQGPRIDTLAVAVPEPGAVPKAVAVPKKYTEEIMSFIWRSGLSMKAIFSLQALAACDGLGLEHARGDARQAHPDSCDHRMRRVDFCEEHLNQDWCE